MTRSRRLSRSLLDPVTVGRFSAKVAERGPAECWEWQGSRDRAGYGQFNVPGYGPARAHRVAVALSRGEVPAGAVVMHACDHPPCCNPAHLSVGSHADNMQDASKKGRLRVTRRRKLTEEDVRALRLAAASGETYASLGRRLGITTAAVSLIARGLRKTLVSA